MFTNGQRLFEQYNQVMAGVVERREWEALTPEEKRGWDALECHVTQGEMHMRFRMYTLQMGVAKLLHALAHGRLETINEEVKAVTLKMDRNRIENPLLVTLQGLLRIFRPSHVPDIMPTNAVVGLTNTVKESGQLALMCLTHEDQRIVTAAREQVELFFDQ